MSEQSSSQSSSSEATASSQQHVIEQVLVVPTLLFHELGHFQGINPNVAPYLKTLLDPMHTSYRPRDQMEQDPSFKQLIPYCIFRCDGEIFHYRRSKGQGEARLHAKRSIGVGGHICTLDQSDEEEAYILGMQREIEEEVEVRSSWKEQLIGILNDDESEVGKVHLGLVHLFELERPQVFPREETMIEAGFSSPAELLREIDQFETWSQICLKSLFSEHGSC